MGSCTCGKYFISFLSALNKKILWRIMLREKSYTLIYRGTKFNISPEVWGRENSYPN